MQVMRVGGSDWRAKHALSGEVDEKLRVAAHARMWCIYVCVCRTFITLECTEDFTDSTNIKRRKWSSWKTSHGGREIS